MLQVGAVFANDFRVLRPLGEGGMGAVFVAEQLSTGAQRALKIVRPELVHDPMLRQRFEQEAKVSARIPSDHVVQVVAAGIDPARNIPWLAMELLQGQTLADALHARGPLPPEQTAEIVSQLCHALAAAHNAGIVHRDLKPENIFLAEARRTGVPFLVKVLDFGIARVLAEAKKTSTGPLGTPLWMAPEQTTSNANIGPWTDVWSFGLIVFWMLTGREYWLAAAQDGSTMSILREILVEPLAPASERARVLGAGPLPPGFDAWFARCVDRDPSARFAQIVTARDALLSILRGAPVATAPTVLPTTPMTSGQTAPGWGPAPTSPAAPIAAPTPPMTAPAAAPVQERAPERGKQSGGRPVGVALVVAVVFIAIIGAVAWRFVSQRRDVAACASNATPVEKRLAACERQCDGKGNDACVTFGRTLARAGTDEQLSRGVTVLAAACEAGSSAACRDVGSIEAFPPRPSMKPDAKKAAAHWQRACNGGDGYCGPLALAQELGWAGARKDAFATYERACRAGDELGCAGRAAAVAGFRAPPGTKPEEGGSIASLRARCDAGDAEGCALAGVRAEAANDTTAPQSYRRACDLGDPMGCNALGVALVRGFGGPAQPAEALTHFQRACAGGDPVGCNNAGALQSGLKHVVRAGPRGDAVLKLRCQRAFQAGCAGWGEAIDPWPGGPRNLAAAVEGYEKACEAGLTTACVNLGGLVLVGQGAPKDHKRAQQLFARACDDGDAGGCGENATVYLLDLVDRPRDVSRAYGIMQTACDAGEADACANVWSMLSRGEGVRANPDEAARRLVELCDQKDVGCGTVAQLHLDGLGVPKDVKKGRALLDAACSGGKGRECDVFAYLVARGEGGDRSPTKAIELWRAACDEDDIQSCVRLGYLHTDGVLVPKDYARAAELFKKGCDAGSARACNGLSQAYLNGDGLAKDERRGAELAHEACDDGYAPGCGAYGILLVAGIGVPKDPERALPFLRTGCQDELDLKPQYQYACQRLRELGKPLPPHR